MNAGRVVGCWLFCLLAAGSVPVRAAQPEPGFSPVRVIVVRHAEKAPEPKEDPPLSDAGWRRARRLAELLGKSGVTALYASDRQRTQQTLQPLSERVGAKVQPIDPRDPGATARAVLSHPGGVVVVAGHSNTVGAIVELLGGGKIAPMGDDEYDDVYVVTVATPGKASVLRLSLAP